MKVPYLKTGQFKRIAKHTCKILIIQINDSAKSVAQTDNVHPYGLCLKCKKCQVQNKNMRYIIFTGMVCTSKSIPITLKATRTP